MAKVKSLNNSSSFYGNDSLLPTLKHGLEITENCSSKYDFDISLLLSDKETLPEKQCTDNVNWSGEKIDKIGRSSPQNSLKTDSSKFASLCTLAENNLKQNNRMLPELNFDSDFDLSALLSNDECSLLNNSENYTLHQSDNLFDLSFLTGEENPVVESKSNAKNDVSFDDLSLWINSSVTQATDPLEIFHNHLSPDDSVSKFEDLSPVTLKIKNNNIDTDFKECDCFDNIQGNPELKKNSSNIDLVNLLGETSIDSSKPTAPYILGRFETNGIEYESTNKILDSDGEFLPDIDLTFCIKKNSKYNNLQYGDSPETVDSGFDELNFSSSEISSSPEGLFSKDISTPKNGNYNKNITPDKVKQSLFSKAISVKHKIDNSRKSKLKSVMDDLLKRTVPLMHCVHQVHLQSNEKVIDQSNENIITSSYQKITDEK